MVQIMSIFQSNKIIAFAFILFIIFSFGTAVNAADFDLKQYNEYVTEKNDSTGDTEAFASNVSYTIGDLTANIVEIGFNLFSILFVSAVVALAAAITLKHGQWMKWSTNTMIFTLIAILLIRLGPILFLTVNLIGFKQLLQYTIHAVVTALFYISVGMMLISLFLNMLHRMFEHPKYFKWSRNLLNGSLIVFILSIFAPVVIGNL